MERTKDLALEVLKQIRTEVKGTHAGLREANTRIDATNEKLDATNERLDATNSRLDATNDKLERLERRQVESETRLATELVAVTQAVHEVRDLVIEGFRGLRVRIDDHELRIRELESQ